MAAFLKKNKIHIWIWGLMLVYLLVAQSLHTRFFLKYGKPVSDTESLPQESSQIRFRVDGLDEIVLEKEELYKLWGWSFSTLNPAMYPEMYEREIILISDSKIYTFKTDVVERPGVQDSFKQLNMNLVKSGFSALISKDALPVGEYRVGILYKDPSTKLKYYTDKPKVILKRSPNGISLER